MTPCAGLMEQTVATGTKISNVSSPTETWCENDAKIPVLQHHRQRHTSQMNETRRTTPSRSEDHDGRLVWTNTESEPPTSTPSVNCTESCLKIGRGVGQDNQIIRVELADEAERI